jgi:hypothetical protein
MLTSPSELLLTSIILASTAYTASKTPAIWSQYEGRYGRLLVGVPLVGFLFGIVHLGMVTPLPHGLLAAVETGALLGVTVVIGVFGYIHPRLGHFGGELR